MKVFSRDETWLNVERQPRKLLTAKFAWNANRERRIISERTKSQTARLKALGVHVGRPKRRKDRRPGVRWWAMKPALPMTGCYASKAKLRANTWRSEGIPRICLRNASRKRNIETKNTGILKKIGIQ